MSRLFPLISFIGLLLIGPYGVQAQTPQELFEKALQLDKDGFLDEEAETLEKILKIGPHPPLESLTRLKLSGTYLKMREPYKAIESVQPLCLSQPGNFDAQFHLGNALARIKDFPKAVAAFKKTVEIRPDEGLAYIGLALSYYGNRNPDAAKENLQKAKTIFKKKKNIAWYRDARIMVFQINSFAKYPANFSDLWLENNLDVVRKTYEKAVFNLKKLKKQL
ncbi:MAG: tetratricopeptide repeat protein [Nitrospinaceae bacterium]